MVRRTGGRALEELIDFMIPLLDRGIMRLPVWNNLQGGEPTSDSV